MSQFNGRQIRCLVLLSIALLLLAALMAGAEEKPVKVQGFIIGRGGDEMIVQYGGGAELAFQLTHNTQVSQVGGLFKASGHRSRTQCFP